MKLKNHVVNYFFKVTFHVVILVFVSPLPLGAVENLQQDSICCYILKDDAMNTSLSRAQFVLSQRRLCNRVMYPVSEIESLIRDLEYLQDLNYSADTFALEWKITSDTILSVVSICPPVKALLVRLTPPNKDGKYYTIDNTVSLIWITSETVEIDNREYRLSCELNELLFGDN